MTDIVAMLLLSAIAGAVAITPIWALWFAVRWIIGFINEYRELDDDSV